jgi:cyclohexadienyl dehydratase
MIAETIEAHYHIKNNPKLAAPLIDIPFTQNCFGILMRKECSDLLKAVNT